MWCRLLPGAISHRYRNDSGRSSRTGSGVEHINYARVLVSSGSTHSLWSVSLRVHSWVYWINVLGMRRQTRKREFSLHRKINTWGITYWDILFCHTNGELFGGFFSTEKTFVVLSCFYIFDSRKRGKLINHSLAGKSLLSEHIAHILGV